MLYRKKLISIFTGKSEQPVKYVYYCVIIREATNVHAKDWKLFVEIWFSEGIQMLFLEGFLCRAHGRHEYIHKLYWCSSSQLVHFISS